MSRAAAMRGTAKTNCPQRPQHPCAGNAEYSRYRGVGCCARTWNDSLSGTLLRLLREVLLALFVRRLIRGPGLFLRINVSLPPSRPFLGCGFFSSLRICPAPLRAEITSGPEPRI